MDTDSAGVITSRFFGFLRPRRFLPLDGEIAVASSSTGVSQASLLWLRFWLRLRLIDLGPRLIDRVGGAVHGRLMSWNGVG